MGSSTSQQSNAERVREHKSAVEEVARRESLKQKQKERERRRAAENRLNEHTTVQHDGLKMIITSVQPDRVELHVQTCSSQGLLYRDRDNQLYAVYRRVAPSLNSTDDTVCAVFETFAMGRCNYFGGGGHHSTLRLYEFEPITDKAAPKWATCPEGAQVLVIPASLATGMGIASSYTGDKGAWLAGADALPAAFRTTYANASASDTSCDTAASSMNEEGAAPSASDH